MPSEVMDTMRNRPSEINPHAPGRYPVLVYTTSHLTSKRKMETEKQSRHWDLWEEQCLKGISLPNLMACFPLPAAKGTAHQLSLYWLEIVLGRKP